MNSPTLADGSRSTSSTRPRPRRIATDQIVSASRPSRVNSTSIATSSPRSDRRSGCVRARGLVGTLIDLDKMHALPAQDRRRRGAVLTFWRHQGVRPFYRSCQLPFDTQFKRRSACGPAARQAGAITTPDAFTGNPLHPSPRRTRRARNVVSTSRPDPTPNAPGAHHQCRRGPGNRHTGALLTPCAVHTDWPTPSDLKMYTPTTAQRLAFT